MIHRQNTIYPVRGISTKSGIIEQRIFLHLLFYRFYIAFITLSGVHPYLVRIINEEINNLFVVFISRGPARENVCSFSIIK